MVTAQAIPVISATLIAIAIYRPVAWRLQMLSALAVASPDSKLIATLDKTCLQIRTVPQLHVIRDFKVPQELYVRKATPTSSSTSTPSFASTTTIRWAQWRNSNSESRRRSDTYSPTRLLLANDQHVWVYDLQDEKWSATIDNGSASMGNIVCVDFGASDTEVIVLTDYSSKVTIWSLESGRAVEIKDPKYASVPFSSSLHSAARVGCGYRPIAIAPSGSRMRADVFALLARSAAQDILLLLVPQSYSIVKTVLLTTVDAQGVKWSPDGNWLAVWEAASIGYKVHIYTADGNLYRVYSGNMSEDEGEGDGGALGVRCIEWSPKGDLAVGDHARRVTLLNSRTFSPVVFLEHTAEIQLSQGEVWEEQIHPSGQRSYAQCPQPVKSPIYNANHNHNHHVSSTTFSYSTSLPKTGVSILTFNSTGTLIATRDDHAPTTVWIWNIDDLTPRAVLIHGTPVKSLNWHPSNPDLLLIQCHRETTTTSSANIPNLAAQAQHQQSKSQIRIYIWHNSTGPTILDAPSLTSTTILPGTKKEKSEKVDNAEPHIQWLRTDATTISSSSSYHPSSSSSSFSFNSSTAQPLPQAHKSDTATSSKKPAAPRLLLTTPHACVLVGIPTLDLDTADANTKTNNAHARPCASSSGVVDVKGPNIQRKMSIANDDVDDDDNENNNNNTLDEVSFASFDFTAGPSAFMTETGYSVPTDATKTYAQNEY